MRFRLVPKSMTSNDHCTTFKVIDSLNAAKNGEIQFSNDSDAMYIEWLDAL